MPLIWNGQWGGLSDSKWSGILGSFAAAVGIDGRKNPGTLTVHQKLTKNSGATVTEFCKVAVAASNGYSFWFSADSGKIWARSSAGTWSLAYTTSAGAGTSTCSGAAEYNGYIYWATQSRLHRVTIAGADDSWAAGAVSLDWATFAVTDASFHPMVVQNEVLFIGDGYQVASVDPDYTGGTPVSFNNNALDIKTPLRIKTMIAYEFDLLIGTYVADTVNKTTIIRWDTIADSWSSTDTIEEQGINCFIRDDNYVYVNAGLAGNLYFYDGAQLQAFKKIPGTYSSSAYGLVHPGSSANFQGVPVFGFSNGSGNPAPEGVYSLGSYSKDYPKVLSLDWVISEAVTSGIEVGAILVLNFDLMVAWKNSSSYGVDAIDYSNKYASASLETMMLFGDARTINKTLRQAWAAYNSLPASTGITFSYSINGAAYVAMTSTTDAVLNQIYTDSDTVGDVGSLQIKIAFTVSSNNAPVVEAIGVEINGLESR